MRKRRREEGGAKRAPRQSSPIRPSVPRLSLSSVVDTYRPLTLSAGVRNPLSHSLSLTDRCQLIRKGFPLFVSYCQRKGKKKRG